MDTRSDVAVHHISLCKVRVLNMKGYMSDERARNSTEKL